MAKDTLDYLLANLDLHTLYGDISLPVPDVAAIRIRMCMNQRTFARRFGFPLATLRHWEHEDRKPQGAALVLLHVIAENPRAVLHVLGRIRLKSATPLS